MSVDALTYTKRIPQSIAGLPTRTAMTYAVLFACALLFYSALWRGAPFLAADTPGYIEVAQDLSDFKIDQLHERSPGYPLLLLLTGSVQKPNRGLFFFSLALHFASVWLLAAVLYATGLKERALNLFGLLLVLPPYTEWAAYVLTETLAEFTLVAGFASLAFWLLHRRSAWLIASAVSIGYSALTRPTYQVLCLILVACLGLMLLLFRRARFINFRDLIKAGLALITASVIMVGGYSLVNYQKFGFFGLTPLLGFNLSTRTVPFVERLPNDHAAVRETLLKYRDASLIKRNSSHTGYQYIWAAKPELSDTTGLTNAQLGKYMVGVNLLLIRKAPLEYLEEVTRSMSKYWFPAATELANMNSPVIQLFWVLLHLVVVGFFALQLLVMLGVAVYVISRRLVAGDMKTSSVNFNITALQAATYTLAGAIVLYTMLISCAVDVGDTRQRVPSDALSFFMLFLGMHIWWRSLRGSAVSSECPAIE